MSGRLARDLPQHRTVQTDGVRTDGYVSRVRDVDLPPRVATLADEYERRIGLRDRFLWQWIYDLFDAFTLSCVPAGRRAEVTAHKTVLTMFVTVVDDVADRQGDATTFAQARRVPFAPGTVDADAPGVETETVEFLEELYASFSAGLAGAPRSDEFDDVFEFDLRGTLTGIEYARVLNDNPEMANLRGSRHYGPFNMAMFPYADVDLAFSPSFRTSDLGPLRSLLYDLQQLARIGNWVTTWERELAEGDVSAGVVVEAVERGVLDPASAGAGADETLVDRIREHGIERAFREEWDDRYDDLTESDHGLDSVDGDALVRGMETVMHHHEASCGYK
jgi:hypothetical protein